MTISNIGDIEFGEALPAFEPDTSLANVKRFAVAAGWDTPRFTDHEYARKEGLPGALIPGIMNQGFLSAMIHRWAPEAEVRSVDTLVKMIGRRIQGWGEFSNAVMSVAVWR